MDAIQSLCELLQQKKDYFEVYGQNTVPLLDCAAEDIEHYITKRAELANEIDKVSEKIEEICKTAPQGALLRDAAANRCDFSTLPPALRPVFQAAQDMLGAMNFVAAQEPAALSRMQGFLAEYRAAIAATQNAPKIAKYLSGMQGADEIGLLGSRDTV